MQGLYEIEATIIGFSLWFKCTQIQKVNQLHMLSSKITFWVEYHQSGMSIVERSVCFKVNKNLMVVKCVTYLSKKIINNRNARPRIVYWLRSMLIGLGKLKNSRLSLKREVFIRYVLPDMTYGWETWTVYTRMTH